MDCPAKLFLIPPQIPQRCFKFENISLKITIIFKTYSMGNNSTKKSLVLETRPLTLNHPRLANTTFKKTFGGQAIMTELPLNNQQQYEGWVKDMERQPGRDLEGVFNPVKHSYIKTGMCGSSGAAKIQYDNYPFILKQTIKERQNSERRKFKENELWYLVYAIAAIGSRYHSNKTKVGDLRPLNIFLNQDGQIKIASQFTWPSEPSNYQKALRNGEKAYLAPEEVKNLQIGYSEPISKIGPAESFSAGLTILDAAILQNNEQLYEKQKIFDFDLLEERQKQLICDQHYSELLKHVILNLTELYPEDRMVFEELGLWLQNYSESILNLDQFESKEVPEKLKNTRDKNPIEKVMGNESASRFLKRSQNYTFIKKAESKELSYAQQTEKEEPEVLKLQSKPSNQERKVDQDDKNVFHLKSYNQMSQRALPIYNLQVERRKTLSKPKVNIKYMNRRSRSPVNVLEEKIVPKKKEIGEISTQTMEEMKNNWKKNPEKRQTRFKRQPRKDHHLHRNELMSETKKIKERSSSTFKRIQQTIELSKKMFPSPSYDEQ